MGEEKNTKEGTAQEKEASFFKNFPKKDRKQLLKYALVSLVIVAAGLGSGWYLSGGTEGAGVLGNGDKAGPATSKPGAKEAGIADESTFRDSAEGILEAGGIDGEGTHHLVREGGPSKYVYLTSTVIDLDSFVGKNVKVWGETITAQQAGWLMDVGKIKVQ